MTRVRIDRHARVAPDATHVVRSLRDVERGDDALLEHVDSHQSAVGVVAVLVGLVAEARDWYIETVPTERQATPDVLGAGVLDDAQRPAGGFLSRRQAQRV